jgi:hypothetical protein
MQFTHESLIKMRYKRARTNAATALIHNRLEEILRDDTATAPGLSKNDLMYLEENGLNTTEWERLEDDTFENVDFSYDDDIDEIVSDQEEEEILDDKGIYKKKVISYTYSFSFSIKKYRTKYFN